MRTIVLGPPGTGKTTTLLNKVDDYLKNTDPDKVGYFAFTQKAAYEARDRCEDGSWGYNYWTEVAAYLLRNLNRYIHLDVDTKTKEGQEHVVYNYH